MRMLLALGLLGFSAVTAHGEDYAIKVSRPHVAGEKYHASIKVSDVQNKKMILNERVVKEQEMKVSFTFEGVVSIQTVSPKGKIRKATLLIETLSAGTGTEKPLVPEKTEIQMEASDDGKNAYLTKEGPISEQGQIALDRLLEKNRDKTADDDAVYGTKERKKPGDSWTINPDELIKSMSEMSFTMKPEDLSGKFSLVEVKDQDGVPAEHVKGAVNVAKFELNRLPPGGAMEKSSLVVEMEGWFPLDPAQRTLREKFSMNLKILIKITPPNGTDPMMAESTGVMTRDAQYSPVK